MTTMKEVIRILRNAGALQNVKDSWLWEVLRKELSAYPETLVLNPNDPGVPNEWKQKGDSNG